MSNFTSIQLPRPISVSLPFKKAIGEKGEVREGIGVNVRAELLSSNGELGDVDMVATIVESRIEEIIYSLAQSRSTLSSLENLFKESKAIPIPGHPGLFLKADSLIFEKIQEEG